MGRGVKSLTVSPNLAYNRGVSWERDVMAMLEANKWAVIRAAGSHGPIDVLAGKWGREWAYDTRRLAIQCKTNRARFSVQDREALLAEARQFDATPILAERKGRARRYTNLGKTYLLDREVGEEWFK